MLSKKLKKSLFKKTLKDEIQEIAHHLKYILQHQKLIPVMIPIKNSKPIRRN